MENKLAIMSNRIRDLEDALQLEFSTRRALEKMLCTRESASGSRERDPMSSILVSLESEISNNDLFAEQGIGNPSTPENIASDDTHPLLAADLLNIKKCVDQNSSSSKVPNKSGDAHPEEPDETSEMMSAFGMLSIRDGQYVRLLGASAAEVRSLSFSISFLLSHVFP